MFRILTLSFIAGLTFSCNVEDQRETKTPSMPLVTKNSSNAESIPKQDSEGIKPLPKNQNNFEETFQEQKESTNTPGTDQAAIEAAVKKAVDSLQPKEIATQADSQVAEQEGNLPQVIEQENNNQENNNQENNNQEPAEEMAQEKEDDEAKLAEINEALAAAQEGDTNEQNEEVPLENNITQDPFWASALKKIIGFLSNLPVVGDVIANLDLDNLINSTVAFFDREAGSGEELAKAIMSSVIGGLKLVPNLSGTVTKIEPFIRMATDFIAGHVGRFFEGVQNRIAGATLVGEEAEETSVAGKKIMLVLDNPNLTQSLYNSLGSGSTFRYADKYITLSGTTHTKLNDEISKLIRQGVASQDIFLLYQNNSGMPVIGSLR